MRSFLFTILIPITLTGGAFVLFIQLLWPLRSRIGGKIQKFAVVVAILLFILPISLLAGRISQPDSLSPQATPSAPTPMQVFQDSSLAAPIVATGEALDQAAQPPSAASSQPAEPNRPATMPAFSFSRLLLYLYVGGTILFAVISTARYTRLRRQLAKTSAAVTDENTLSTYRALCDEIDIKRAPQLRISDRISSPLLVGIIRPAIILPGKNLPAKSVSFAMRHELTHYKNHDIFLKLGVIVLSVAHWFNPAIYLLRNRISDACETTCDEQVSAGLSAKERRAYANALIHFSAVSVPVGAAGFSAPTKKLQQRLSGVVAPKTSRILRMLGSGIIAVALCFSLLVGCGLGAGSNKDAENGSIKESDSLLLSDFADAGFDYTQFAFDLESGSYTMINPEKNDTVTITDLVWPTVPQGAVLRYPYPVYDDDYPGLDIASNSSTEIVAVLDGTVVATGTDDASYGNYVLLDHGDYFMTFYAFCGAISVAKDDIVSQGQPLAMMGNPDSAEGYQFHFEALVNASPINPAILLYPYLPSPSVTSLAWPTGPGYFLSRGYIENEHFGLDVAAPYDTPIYAVEAGVVVLAENTSVGYGHYIIIDHGNGLMTLYAQCNKLLVSVGDKVTKGHEIASMGSSGNSTGPHLHFEIRIYGIAVPVEPYFDIS